VRSVTVASITFFQSLETYQGFEPLSGYVRGRGSPR
jgi:hypothetical protein